jgi:hypothetical protein
MRYRTLVVASLFLVFLAGGCGGEANRVPQVQGKRLDVAQKALDDAGLGYEVTGGGAFGVVVRSNWVVCEQRPRAGKVAKSVELVVGRSCVGTVPYDENEYENEYEYDDDYDYDYDYDEDDDDDF